MFRYFSRFFDIIFSMRFALDDNGERVEIDSAAEGGHYRCPLCHKDMIQRRGEIRAHHYAHKQYDGCVDDWSYDESEWHDHWTKQFPNDNAEYILCHGTLKHFADIYITERKLVVEFRSDYITRPDFDRRNSYFTATGNQVIWVFDLAEEYAKLLIQRDADLPDQYEWHQPYAVFKKPLETVDVFFQVKEANFPYKGRLIKLKETDYDCGTFSFASDGVYNEDQFIDYAMKGTIQINQHPICNLSDPLITFAYRDQRQVVYFCPRGAKGLFDWHECSLCEWHGEPSNGHMTCRKRIETLYRTDFDYIQSWDVDKEGRIAKVVFSQDGEEKVFAPAPIKPLGHCMTTWWKDYQPKIAIFRNLQTGEEVKLHGDPALSLEKYHHAYGYYRTDENFEKSVRPIPNALDPIWVIVWFK